MAEQQDQPARGPGSGPSDRSTGASAGAGAEDSGTGRSEGRAAAHDGNAGAAREGDDAPGPARTPAEALLASLQRALGEMFPERGRSAVARPDALVRDAMDGLRPALDGFLTELELVPRREFEGYLASLERLQQTISDLEARIAVLEQDDQPTD